MRGGLVRLDPDVIDLLRLGVYQLLYMGSVPAYAAIAQTVELAKRRHGLGASKLVNAVLRRTDRERENLFPAQPTDTLDALALKYSHPRWLIARWIERYGEQDTERLLTLNNEPAIIRTDALSLSVTPQIANDTSPASMTLSLTPIVRKPAVAESDMVARVADGETLIVSGFTRDRETRERRSAGVTGGGWFGRSTVVTRRRIELVILLTPRIVTDVTTP